MVYFTLNRAKTQRKAYGFRNIQNMMDMIYMVCSNIDIPLPNRKSMCLETAQLLTKMVFHTHKDARRAKKIPISEWHWFNGAPNVSF